MKTAVTLQTLQVPSPINLVACSKEGILPTFSLFQIHFSTLPCPSYTHFSICSFAILGTRPKLPAYPFPFPFQRLSAYGPQQWKVLPTPSRAPSRHGLLPPPSPSLMGDSSWDLSAINSHPTPPPCPARHALPYPPPAPSTRHPSSSRTAACSEVSAEL